MCVIHVNLTLKLVFVNGVIPDPEDSICIYIRLLINTSDMPQMFRPTEHC